MKVQAGSADRFVASPGPEVSAILVYGPDAGLVRERCLRAIGSAVEDRSDPFRVSEIAAAQLRSDPARLRDELFALSLVGGRRVVFLRGAGDPDAPVVSEALDEGGFEALLVAEAGDLSPRSALRKLFEQSRAAAAVPCYQDDARSLPELIRDGMAGHGIRIDEDAMHYLCASLGGDRLVSRQELEKLALYAGEGGTVTLADAESCVGDSAAVTLDDIAFAVGTGDPAALIRGLARARANGLDDTAILRVVQRHFHRLHLCAGRVAAGSTPDQAVAGLRPPVFFKRSAEFRSQLSRWSEGATTAAMETLNEAEIACKTTGYPAATVCERALLSLAARRPRRGPGDR